LAEAAEFRSHRANVILSVLKIPGTSDGVVLIRLASLGCCHGIRVNGSQFSQQGTGFSRDFRGTVF
jgi:hypothetical protein